MHEPLPTASAPRPRSLGAAVRSLGLLEVLALGLGPWLVLHYGWFMDDAFVFFRYVDNLLFLGHGLVWNAGEYVEGFSSALWVLVLVPLRALGLDWWTITRLYGVLSYLAFWALLVRLDRHLAPRPRAGAPRIDVPLVYLTACYGVLCYFTSGLETPLVQVAAAAYALFAVRPGSRPLQVLLGTTPLLRHELALPLALALAWSWRRTRRFPLALVLSALVVPGGWLVFRIAYYADLFPNTFYLKDEVDLAQGWTYLRDTTRTYLLGPFLALHAVLLALALRRRPAAEEGAADELHVGARLLMVVMALVIAAYVVKIGGDPRHYRYLAFPFVLVVCACGGLLERALLLLPPPARRPAGLAAGLLLLAGTASLYPRQLSAHPFGGTEEHATVDKINDASGHRHNPHLAQPPFGRGVEVDLRERYAAARAAHAAGAPPYARVDTHSFCVRMFRELDVRWIQRLGLTEPVLARTSVPADRPAHKLGLIPLAHDLVRIVAWTGNRPHRGMYRAAVEAGQAPSWVRDNLATIEVIERKQFNEHRFLENLRLAFTFPPRIEVGRYVTRPAPGFVPPRGSADPDPGAGSGE